MEIIEVLYRPGDRVRFEPKHRKYEAWEMPYAGNICIVQDYSDLPIVEFEDSAGTINRRVAAVDQRDLVRA